MKLLQNEIIIRMIQLKNIYNAIKLLEVRESQQISMQLMQKNVYQVIKNSLILLKVKWKKQLKTLNKLRIIIDPEILTASILLVKVSLKIAKKQKKETICLRSNLFMNQSQSQIAQTSYDFYKLFLKLKLYVIFYNIYQTNYSQPPLKKQILIGKRLYVF
ncbi:hypothetical protein TTHERM_000242109 (macronuclear) [Tetrahymena thermophila SB210]|uniref:Uncharacterized protein n=1 Tax=Tetrahymena thermophila (strain SB210) TaxID=312017 RepID=W7X646_TETTS|nr:hypothetical protein TTHERM_000242109 [Tetrahymena thermophila SB210]EWS71798.1 hypothetical protein TTHERM_000242109 [Tetrahymena thermophila SB210]|eukprot:XP_012655685.1 hypothetical protein TTHERM_000242109 [Tetrahymena thermophila SB210]